MNKLLIMLISAATLGTSLPVLAGPDWQAIEQARKAKQATQVARHGDAMPTKDAESMQCPPDALVLPLDHGPRAQSTPYLNRLRKERHDAQVTACQEPMK